MMTRRGWIAAMAVLPGAARAEAEAVTLRAADGLAVFGEALAPAGRPRGAIALFHMASSNRGEYAPIAPELVRRGFATLAIDQRSGGPAWGRGNQTAAQLARDPGYLAALPDLRAAAVFARQRWPGAPLLLWGSSYSAALVFLLAAEPGVAPAALLACSPGEYLSGTSVRQSAARVTCPIFVTSDAGAEEAAAAALLAASPAAVLQQYRPAAGAHGSSILRSDRNPRGAAAAWAAVGGFLDTAVPG
jgi:alpha-beta hydrolase superfamily lysophospholipase